MFYHIENAIYYVHNSHHHFRLKFQRPSIVLGVAGNPGENALKPVERELGRGLVRRTLRKQMVELAMVNQLRWNHAIWQIVVRRNYVLIENTKYGEDL